MFKKKLQLLCSVILIITFSIKVTAVDKNIIEDYQLYKYFMEVYSQPYYDLEGALDSLSKIQTEYDIARQNNFKVDSLEALRNYASVIKEDFHRDIDEKINSIVISQQKIVEEASDIFFNATPIELSTLSISYYNQVRYIEKLLEDKNSFNILSYESPYYRMDEKTLIDSLNKQQEEIRTAASIDNIYLGNLDSLRYPFESKVIITSRVGYRINPFGTNIQYHNATDFAMPEGTIIKSIFNGIVIRADNRGDGYGNIIKIDSGNGIVVSYAHLSEINVEVGQKVEQNQNIGLSGNTGLSTGPHLHLGLELNSQVLDILRLF